MSYPITSPTTQEMAADSWRPVGDTTDPAWYRTIRHESGKPHPNAVAILARIVYMFRPIKILDQQTGLDDEVCIGQKFVADQWQASRQMLADEFGFTKREVDSALETLRRLGIIKTELRSLKVNGVRLSNVLYIDLNLPKLKEISTPITFERNTSGISKSEVIPPNEKAVLSKRSTYTKTSHKISPINNTTTTSAKSSSTSASPPTKPKPPPAGRGEKNSITSEISEAVMGLIPLQKQNLRHQRILKAALSAAGETIVINNITQAVAKAKSDDPWGLVMTMLSDLAEGNDWYSETRAREAVEAAKQASTKYRQQKEAETIERNRRIELQQMSQLVRLLESLPESDRQMIDTLARNECEKIGATMTVEVLYGFTMNHLADRLADRYQLNS